MGESAKLILDACCGGRMFWFDPMDDRAVFMDKRKESVEMRDGSSIHGVRTLLVNPDIVGDFTNIPFPDGQFAVVVFDPPHLVRVGRNAWLAKKYGRLEGDWRDMLRRGFIECFRVLRDHGVLIFKWNERDIPVSEILELTTERPLIGQKSGKAAMTHWIVFVKPAPTPTSGPTA